MLSIQKSIQIKDYNTFGLDYKAEYLVPIKSEEDLNLVFTQKLEPKRILGGGSNVLITGDIPGYVLKSEIKGFDKTFENHDIVEVEVGAGETWHDFVEWTMARDYGGLENLSLIPGTAGAAPIQNIGAYGVEQKDTFVSLQAFNLNTGEIETFSKEQCRFNYRDSYFKNEGKNKYFITRVKYALTKKNHILHTEYGDIKQKLAEKKLNDFSIRDISACVIDIRRSKLPDPKEIGNAGSFFKNPVIQLHAFEALKRSYPTVPHYPGPVAEEVKISAAWLIDKLGFKGLDRHGIGVHDKQALVLVNRKNGDGNRIYELAKEIKEAVLKNYNIALEMEVNIW